MPPVAAGERSPRKLRGVRPEAVAGPAGGRRRAGREGRDVEPAEHHQVVVSDQADVAPLARERDALVGLRAVAHQVSEAPGPLRLRGLDVGDHRLEGGEVSVHVRQQRRPGAAVPRHRPRALFRRSLQCPRYGRSSLPAAAGGGPGGGRRGGRNARPPAARRAHRGGRRRPDSLFHGRAARPGRGLPRAAAAAGARRRGGVGARPGGPGPPAAAPLRAPVRPRRGPAAGRRGRRGGLDRARPDGGGAAVRAGGVGPRGRRRALHAEPRRLAVRPREVDRGSRRLRRRRRARRRSR